MKTPMWIEHLKSKWNIESNRDFIVIMLVFSLAGMAITFVRQPIFHWLGVTSKTPFWIKTLIYLPLIPPIYQVNLLVFGFLLGQFDFFWNKEKQLGRFILRFFSRRRN